MAKNIEHSEIQKILDGVPNNYVQNVKNKAHDTKQNFSIYPQQSHENSSQQKVGDLAASPIKNEIDQQSLRSTNLPFQKTKREDTKVSTLESIYEAGSPQAVNKWKSIRADQ